MTSHITLRMTVPRDMGDRLRGYIGIVVHDPAGGVCVVDVSATGPDGLRFIADALEGREDRWPRLTPPA